MKRVSIFFVSILVSFAVSCSTSSSTDEYSMISFMIGDVSLNGSGAEISQLIKKNDIIKTGVDSFCDIKIGGSMIRIKQKTEVSLSMISKNSGNENTSIELKVGKMLCKPKKLLKGDSFTIKTPTAVAGVRGTQFSVEADKRMTTRIKVFKGKVKVVKRIKILEGGVDKILESAPAVEKKHKVIITRKDVTRAEKRVKRIVDRSRKKDINAIIDTVLKKARRDVVVKKRDIMKFSPTDFAKDKKELIAIRQRPKEVVKKIEKVIKEEKKAPQPNGRLLITRYAVYYIKNGIVEWEGKVYEPALQKEGKLYIASEDYIFCASVDGPVYWRKKIANNGKLRIDEKGLVVTSAKGTKTFDLLTGEKL